MKHRFAIALLLAAVSLNALAAINPNPPPAAAPPDRYMAMIVGMDKEFDLVCVVWSEQRMLCQAIRKSKYMPCALVDGELACRQSF